MQAVIVAGWPGPSRYMSAVKRKSLASLAIELVPTTCRPAGKASSMTGERVQVLVEFEPAWTANCRKETA